MSLQNTLRKQESKRPDAIGAFIYVLCFVAFLLVLFSFVFQRKAHGQERRQIVLGPAVSQEPIKLAVMNAPRMEDVKFPKSPSMYGPFGIQPTAEQVAIGQMLFFDKRLSQKGTVSCATCHDPKKGWADGLQIAVGEGGRIGRRHTPTAVNSSYLQLIFWDGRAVNEVQPLLPLENVDEMAFAFDGERAQTAQDVIRRLRMIPGYVEAFARSFPIDAQEASPITQRTVAYAMTAFECTLTSFKAPIDLYLAGKKDALSPDAEVGFKLMQQANCFQCHVPPLFTDKLFHNTGVEFATTKRITDQGRYEAVNSQLRKDNADFVRAFKTPSLRDVNRTAPYGHNGFMADLDRVLLHYATGGKKYTGKVDAYIDPRIVPTHWTESQRKYVRIFLQEGMASTNYPSYTEPKLP